MKVSRKFEIDRLSFFVSMLTRNLARVRHILDLTKPKVEKKDETAALVVDKKMKRHKSDVTGDIGDGNSGGGSGGGVAKKKLTLESASLRKKKKKKNVVNDDGEDGNDDVDDVGFEKGWGKYFIKGGGDVRV